MTHTDRQQKHTAAVPPRKPGDTPSRKVATLSGVLPGGGGEVDVIVKATEGVDDFTALQAVLSIATQEAWVQALYHADPVRFASIVASEDEE